MNQNLPGLYGLADGTGPGPPKTAERINIDVARCLGVNQPELDSTIAHELAHGCNVRHHGDSDYEISWIEHLRPDGTWQRVVFPAGLRGRVAAQGGQESGREDCIMRHEGRELAMRLFDAQFPTSYEAQQYLMYTVATLDGRLGPRFDSAGARAARSPS